MDSKNRALYIRADANEQIGTGHIMRCLAIAEALQRRGGTAVFLVADDSSGQLVSQRGFDAVCLHSPWDDLEQELGKLTDLIQQEQAGLLLVDSYYVTPHYLGVLGQYTKLAYIDDLDLCPYPVDLLIRYALYQREGAGRGFPRILGGCKYAPLKSRFGALPRREAKGQVERILVLTGGTDPYHVALGIAQHAADSETYRGLQFHMVCGKYNQDYGKLRELAQGNSRLSVHYNVACMAGLMQEADISVTAGGTTVYELCACGTPSICYIMADNQIQNAQALAREGLMLYGGDVRQENWQKGLFDQLDCLLADGGLRRDMAARMQQLVDGKGANRIAEALQRLQDEKEIHRKGKEGKKKEEKEQRHDPIWTPDN